MKRSQWLNGVLAFCLLTGCRTGGTNRSEPAAPASARERIGYLEHRGQRYPVTALMDASYRRQSDDPFVRGFEPKPGLATPWAGLDTMRHPPEVEASAP